MRFLNAFTNPRDRRWHGAPHWGPSLLLPISILFILVWIFTIAALAYSRVWSDQFDEAQARKDYYSVDYPPIPWNRHKYNGDGPIEIIHPLVVLCLETLHLPLHVYLYATARLHPIAALVLCIFWSGIWISVSFIIFMMDWGAERVFPRAWTALTYSRMAFGLAIGVLYLVYLGYAAAAVHGWRKGKRGGGRDGGKEGEEDGVVLTTMRPSASNVSV